jgi:hypothetical protein
VQQQTSRLAFRRLFFVAFFSPQKESKEKNRLLIVRRVFANAD